LVLVLLLLLLAHWQTYSILKVEREGGIRERSRRMGVQPFPQSGEEEEEVTRVGCSSTQQHENTFGCE
jgi:hypothetical protein